MNIAIDFDDTLTQDPPLWSRFIQDAQSRGHNVYCVTCRRDTPENNEMIDSWMESNMCHIPLIFTSLGSKLHAMESRGIRVDVWIDDMPETIIRGR